MWVLRDTDRPGSSLWATHAELWVGPGLILGTQIVAVAGLLFLCHALRGLARELSKDPGEAVVVQSPLFFGPAVSVAAAFAIASAICWKGRI